MKNEVIYYDSEIYLRKTLPNGSGCQDCGSPRREIPYFHFKTENLHTMSALAVDQSVLNALENDAFVSEEKAGKTAFVYQMDRNDVVYGLGQNNPWH